VSQNVVKFCSKTFFLKDLMKVFKNGEFETRYSILFCEIKILQRIIIKKKRKNFSLVLFMGAQTLIFPIYIDNLLPYTNSRRLWHLCCLFSLGFAKIYSQDEHINQFVRTWCKLHFPFSHTLYLCISFYEIKNWEEKYWSKWHAWKSLLIESGIQGKCDVQMTSLKGLELGS